MALMLDDQELAYGMVRSAAAASHCIHCRGYRNCETPLVPIRWESGDNYLACPTCYSVHSTRGTFLASYTQAELERHSRYV